MSIDVSLGMVGNLIDATTAQTTLNNNFNAIQVALEDGLSRSGDAPNQMEDTLDMNSNQIINLPAPATGTSPLRLQDLSTFNGGGTIANMPAGGTTGYVLAKNSNADFDVEWVSETAALPVPLPVGNVSVGTGTNQDSISIRGHQVLYNPDVPNDIGADANTFYGNGGNNLTHSIVNTTSPGVSLFPVTVTVTIASPGVITWTAHGLALNTPVAFTTTGTLPTGITAGTTYYVAGAFLTANTFTVTTTLNGAAINTTGTQSGVHSGTTISLEGRYNIGIGQQSLPAITNGSYNTSCGFEGMFNTTSGSWNTGFGEATLFSNVLGNSNTAVGWKAILENATGNNNTAVGYGAMLQPVSGSSNTAVGYSALSGGVSSSFIANTAIGAGAGGVITTGNSNSLMGTSTAPAMTTGAQNTAIGTNGVSNLTTGSNNTTLGYLTGGGITTGSNNTIIGANQTGLSSTLANEIRISDGSGALGFRSDASRNSYLGGNTVTAGTGTLNLNTKTLTVNNSIGLSGTDSTTMTFPSASANITQTVASGTAALGTSAIAAGAAATVVTVSATGVLSTDVVTASFNGDPTAVTGYIPSTAGMLAIVAYPTAGNVNFKVINNTASSITPGALTINWRVVR